MLSSYIENEGRKIDLRNDHLNTSQEDPLTFIELYKLYH
jgi:hypothetical protein